jgi:hypothetical protein
MKHAKALQKEKRRRREEKKRQPPNKHCDLIPNGVSSVIVDDDVKGFSERIADKRQYFLHVSRGDPDETRYSKEKQNKTE